ncbi:hypothetical protein MNBD_GAMMA01-1290 [hydrothermal vent metagenome]|uniref:Uncharacterized protein n=1 Tax=hydrothermal vent metagenome TaxID=652676 RepID=A0A3B0W5F1_9ZZZZ
MNKAEDSQKGMRIIRKMYLIAVQLGRIYD